MAGLGVLPGMTFDGVPFQITLSSDEPFGQGGSAEIYKGTLQGSQPDVVAVKFFRDLGTIRKSVREQLLERELQAARQVSMRHESILPFLGTAHAGHRQGIVSLYMKNGNLMQYLKSNPGCNKTELILHVAEAVRHLHSVEKMVHGDLKCENVLVSDSGHALLADFGLSRFVDAVQCAQTTVSGIRRMYTVRFAAPELLFGTAPQSKTRESDIYAFGMLVLEAVTERPPWDGMPDPAVMLEVFSGKRPPRPKLDGTFVSLSHSWWDVCRRCWSHTPGDRPRMRDVLSVLRDTDLDPRRALQGRANRVCSVAYFPGGRKVVSGSLDGYIRVWDALTGHTIIGQVGGYAGIVHSVTLSPDGRQICSGDEYSVICRWDAESGAPIGQPMYSLDGPVNCVAFSSDSTCIVSGSEQNMVIRWHATTGDTLGGPLIGHTDSVRSVAFSYDDECIASGSDDGTVRLWDRATGETLATLKHGNTQVNSVCFSPDGIHLVSGSSDHIVRIWNLSTGQLERELAGHIDRVNSVAISPSGQYIASGSDDQTIRTWAADTGDAVGVPLVGHTSWVLSVAFSPDGRSLVSGSDDGTARIWDLFE